ncbi:fibrinogen alpha chain [Trichomycterus rosablanca]|uniref:fibrinogen alpha chain n=1 Tax=Trichomycterus rosablanca TaxID=2290929 RepID=UPI002F3516B4
MCTDDEQDIKCPSGCRLQGLIDQAEDEVSEHLRKICEKTSQYKTGSSSTMLESARFYEAQRKIIIKTTMEENRFVEAAERLYRNLTLLWKKSSDLSRELQRHHSLITHQIHEIRRLEVDIDIKLRACKGSCKQTFVHLIDHKVYKAMEDKMARFHPTAIQQKPFELDKALKLQPIDKRPSSRVP